MGVRFPSAASNVIVNVAFGAAETVICTTPPINLSIDSAQVLLFFYYAITTGATTTTLRSHLRRGTAVGGVLLNQDLANQVTAGNTVFSSGCYIDTPGTQAEVQYSLTTTQTGATGNGAVLDVCLLAVVL